MSNSRIVWKGKSLLDSSPIMVVLSGFSNKSDNPKTGGDMIQSWILRSDIDPITAVKTGEDYGICGDCRHRGINGNKRSCYVNYQFAPNSIYKAIQRGNVPTITLNAASAFLKGHKLRIGAYGDPAATPTKIWQTLTKQAIGWTGYTHQWKTADPDLQKFCMASADSSIERTIAKNQGWRVFRVKTPNEPKLKGEATCPASEEAGKILTCSDCMACMGLARNLRGDIVINVHGTTQRTAAFTTQTPLETAI